ncbi:hypothetical protein TrVE_jg14144 [Triparma verrucosa]|uniref:Uncharacterized protein n=1 Tax=Triparma verrucosa TaxID=1606542 RepID=A0A9W7C4Z1_9STRA|nr:hypothetical protein TrVE_jg14144 [Triparma verrucosa]
MTGAGTEAGTGSDTFMGGPPNPPSSPPLPNRSAAPSSLTSTLITGGLLGIVEVAVATGDVDTGGPPKRLAAPSSETAGLSVGTALLGDVGGREGDFFLENGEVSAPPPNKSAAELSSPPDSLWTSFLTGVTARVSIAVFGGRVINGDEGGYVVMGGGGMKVPVEFDISGGPVAAFLVSVDFFDSVGMGGPGILENGSPSDPAGGAPNRAEASDIGGTFGRALK